MDCENELAETGCNSGACVHGIPGLDTAAARMACAKQPLLPQVNAPRMDGPLMDSAKAQRGAIERRKSSPKGGRNKGKGSAKPIGTCPSDSEFEMSEDSFDDTSDEACPPARKRKRINSQASSGKRKVSGRSMKKASFDSIESLCEDATDEAGHQFAATSPSKRKRSQAPHRSRLPCGPGKRKVSGRSMKKANTYSTDHLCEDAKDGAGHQLATASPSKRKRSARRSSAARRSPTSRRSRSPARSSKRRQSRGRSSRQRKRGSQRRRSAGGGNINKRYILSPELAAVVGVAAASHGEVSELMWKYIRSHELQDPSSPAYILSDARLKKLFRMKRFKGFGMQKHLKPHFIRRVDDSVRASTSLWERGKSWCSKWFMKK